MCSLHEGCLAPLCHCGGIEARPRLVLPLSATGGGRLAPRPSTGGDITPGVMLHDRSQAAAISNRRSDLAGLTAARFGIRVAAFPGGRSRAVRRWRPLVIQAQGGRGGVMFRRVISVLALAMVLVSVTLASGQSPAATQAAAHHRHQGRAFD